MKIICLQKQLDKTNFEKKQLISCIEDIEKQKNKLKGVICKLETADKGREQEQVAYTSFNTKMEQQNVLLEKLEQRIALKQREWELRSRLLNNEKDLAVHAAKFATQKLADTVSDFQKHTDKNKVILTKMTRK